MSTRSLPLFLYTTHFDCRSHHNSQWARSLYCTPPLIRFGCVASAQQQPACAPFPATYIIVAPLSPLMAQSALSPIYSFSLLPTIRQALFRLLTSPRLCNIAGPTLTFTSPCPCPPHRPTLIVTPTYCAERRCLASHFAAHSILALPSSTPPR